jgi:hypothetical protein
MKHIILFFVLIILYVSFDYDIIRILVSDERLENIHAKATEMINNLQELHLIKEEIRNATLRLVSYSYIKSSSESKSSILPIYKVIVSFSIFVIRNMVLT